MPEVSKKRLADWRERGVLSEFVKDYESADVSREALVEKYGPELGGIPGENWWPRLKEIANSQGCKRPHRSNGHSNGHTNGAVHPAPTPEPTYSDIVRKDAQLVAAQANAKKYQNLYRAALQQLTDHVSLLDTIRDVLTSMPVLKPQRVTVPSGKARGVHAAVAHLSDIHAGEYVDLDAMGGIAQYDMEICRQRIGLWANKVLYLTELRRSRLEIPYLRIALDGDVVSGIIHDELERTNAVVIVEQVAWVTMWLAHAIAQVAAHFPGGTVVECTVGNHGRTRQKKEFKEKYNSWDYVCYQMLAQYLRGYDHIKFVIPKAWWSVMDVLGTRILHWHGDGVRGWAGFPWYGIDRAVKELRQTLQPHGVYFDMAIFAHFHVPTMCEGPTGPFYGNGNFKGGDEFAFGALHKNVRPIQNLFFIHDEHGEVGYEKIYLDGQTAQDAAKLPAYLPPVWADMPEPQMIEPEV